MAPPEKEEKDVEMKDAEAPAEKAEASAEAPADGEAKSEEAAPAEEAKEEEKEEEKPKEPEKPKELEENAPEDGRPKISEPVQFFTPDTTLNVMPAVNGKVLMSLSDGGFQYLLAGARSNVGLKAGRYVFEVAIAETKNAAEPQGQKGRPPAPRNFVRVGLSTSSASLFLNDASESVCFDSEGTFSVGKVKKRLSQKFSLGQVVACVVNLDPNSPNANTISLFRDGVRISEPKAIPDSLKGKTLFPAVAFRNVSLKVNFGPLVFAPLPFKCTPVGLAAAEDCEVAAAPASTQGEVVLPIGLPDEGTFDWLDQFLAKNKNYTEISGRSLLEWAKKSGLQRQGGFQKWSSNDNPETNFGLPPLDDDTVNKVINAVAPALDRNYVVMEVKGNLLAEERKKVLERFPGFKKVAQVVVGEPPEEYKQELQAQILAEKTEAEKKKALAKKQEAG